MSSIIHSCRYNPTGKGDLTNINPLKPLQSQGDLDISTLLQQIVEQDFGYTGTSQYELVLRSREVILSLIDGLGAYPPRYGRLVFEHGQWQLTTTSGQSRFLQNTTEVSARISDTLRRIGEAHARINPSSIPSPHTPEAAASIQATPATAESPRTVVNNHITCDHNALTTAITSLQHMMEQLLRNLQPQPQPAPQASQNSAELQALTLSIATLHETLEHLKKEREQPAERVNEQLLSRLATMESNLQTLERRLAEYAPSTAQVSELKSIHQQLTALTEHLQSPQQPAVAPSLKNKTIVPLPTSNELAFMKYEEREYEQRQQITELEKQIQYLTQEKGKIETRLQQLEETNVKASQDKNEAEEIAREHIAGEEQLREQLHSSQAEKDALLAQLKTMNSQLQSQLQTLEAAGQSLASSSLAEKAQLESRINSLQAQLATQQSAQQPQDAVGAAQTLQQAHPAQPNPIKSQPVALVHQEEVDDKGEEALAAAIKEFTDNLPSETPEAVHPIVALAPKPKRLIKSTPNIDQRIQQFLQEISTAIVNLGNENTVPVNKIGSLLCNLVFLENLQKECLNDNKQIDAWIKTKCPLINSQNLPQVRNSLRAHYDKEQRLRQGVREHYNAVPTMEHIEAQLDACRRNDLFIIPQLQRVLLQMEGFLASSEAQHLGDKSPEIAAAKKAVDQIRPLLKSAGQRLREKEWAIGNAERTNSLKPAKLAPPEATPEQPSKANPRLASNLSGALDAADEVIQLGQERMEQQAARINILEAELIYANEQLARRQALPEREQGIPQGAVLTLTKEENAQAEFSAGRPGLALNTDKKFAWIQQEHIQRQQAELMTAHNQLAESLTLTEKVATKAEHLQSQLKEAHEEIATLTEQLETARETGEHMIAEMAAQADEEIGQLSQQLHELQSVVPKTTELLAELEAAYEKIAALREQLEQATETGQQTIAQVAARADEEIEQLSQKIESLDAREKRRLRKQQLQHRKLEQILRENGQLANADPSSTEKRPAPGVSPVTA
jgi:hypothetical protein